MRGLGHPRQGLAGRSMGGYSRVRTLPPSGASLRTRTRQGSEGNRRLARVVTRRPGSPLHAAADSSLAAALSTNQISFPALGCTNFEGYFSAGAWPSRTSCSTAALSIPLTRNATQRAEFSVGNVNVIRLVPSFFTQLATTIREFSCKAAVSGNKDA